MCRHCEPPPPPSRRDLLRLGAGAAALGALGVSVRTARAEEPATVAAVPNGGRARQVVVLYMNGGASQFETVDPKPGTTNGGPTRAIGTRIPGVQVASTLPETAQRLDRIALLRSMSTREGNHERARYLLHTGYPPQPTVRHASLGAIVSHERGDAHADIPAYVAIGGPGHGAGHLGVHHAPFVVQDAQRPLANVELPRGMDLERRDGRLGFLDDLNEGFADRHGDQVAAAQRAMFERARRLMDSKQRDAFDLSQEMDGVRDRYGRTRFGQNVLLARRLIEQDVPFVEVMMGGWDTHDDNFERVKALNGELDRAYAALLDDLASNGRLASTLVVWVGDFGRTPRITASNGRGHYPQAWSAMLAGGGIQGGRVIGATDASGTAVSDRPIDVPELIATVCHAMGIDGSTTFYDSGRPLTIVDGEAAPVAEVFTA